MQSFLGILTGVFAVGIIIAGGWAGLQKGTVQNLRDTCKDLRDRDADREKKNVDLTNDNARLQSDIAALSRVVTGEAYLTALADKLDEHHDEARTHWAADEQISKETLEVLKRLSGGTG